MLPGVVEDIEDVPHFLLEVARVYRPEPNLGQARDGLPSPLGARGRRHHLVFPPVAVLHLLQTRRLGKRSLIRAVMRRHDRWGRVKPFDEQPGFLVDRQREGPAHDGHSAARKPVLRRGDQRRCDLLVVHRVEEAKEPGIVLVDAKMLMVDLRRDSADRLPVLPCREQRDLGMLEERVLLWREPIGDLHVQRRHPGRVVPIHLEGNLNEVLQILARLVLLDLDAHTLRGPTMSSGVIASSNCSPVRRPSSTAASRSVVSFLYACLATLAALS